MKKSLGAIMNMDSWFEEISPLVNWSELTPKVEQVIEFARKIGINKQNQFPFFYRLARVALEIQFPEGKI